MTNEQFFSYIMEGTSYIQWYGDDVHFVRTNNGNMLNWIFKVLAP